MHYRFNRLNEIESNGQSTSREPTLEEKKYIVKLIHVFRRVRNSGAWLYDMMWRNDRLICKLYNESKPMYENDFDEKIIDKIEKKFIILHDDHKLTFSQVDKFLSKISPWLDKTPYNDQEFQAVMQDILGLLGKIRGLSKKVIHHEFMNSLDAMWIHTLEIMQNIQSLDSLSRADMDNAYFAWHDMSKNEQNDIVQQISSGIDNIISDTKKQDERLRSNMKPEASKDDPFEEFAFAEERYGQVPNEPDNELEKRLYKALVDHFNEGIILPLDDAMQLQDILKSGKYSSVIHGPSQDIAYVYRGMDVTEEWMRSALKLKENDKLPLLGRMKASFTFKPRLGASSWTSNEKIAFDFIESENPENYQIIMLAEISKNPFGFIAGDDGLYRIGDLDRHANEHEIVALGHTNVSMIAWRQASIDDQKFPSLEF